MQWRVFAGASLLVVLAGGMATFAVLHDPPETKDHIARECRFIAALEAKRMVRWRDYGPSPFEIRRADGMTGGEARPDLAKLPNAGLPRSWRATLVQALAPRKDQPPIDCTAALDQARIPKVNKYNDGPSLESTRFQYSRVTFLPGDRYALFRSTSCAWSRDAWDQDSDFRVWRRVGDTWEPASSYDEPAMYMPPRFKPPVRCFEQPPSI